MPAALIAGERDPEILAELSKGTLRRKVPSEAKCASPGLADIEPEATLVAAGRMS